MNVIDGKRYISYTEIHKSVEKIARAIKEQLADDPPEIMVAIGGGGFIPARMLRTFMKIPILAVALRLYSEDDKPMSQVDILQWLDQKSLDQIKGKRVIVVDEVDDTRTTLHYCVSALQKEGANVVGVVVVHNKKKQKRANLPESIRYFEAEEAEDIWIVYPWDATDIEEHEKKANRT